MPTKNKLARNTICENDSFTAPSRFYRFTDAKIARWNTIKTLRISSSSLHKGNWKFRSSKWLNDLRQDLQKDHLVLIGLIHDNVICSKFTTKPRLRELFSTFCHLHAVFTWVFFSSLLLRESQGYSLVTAYTISAISKPFLSTSGIFVYLQVVYYSVNISDA